MLFEVILTKIPRAVPEVVVIDEIIAGYNLA